MLGGNVKKKKKKGGRGKGRVGVLGRKKKKRKGGPMGYSSSQ